MPQNAACSPASGLETVGVFEQADAQIVSKIDVFAVTGNAAISNTHNQLAFNHSLEVDVVCDFFGSGQYLPGEFNFATAKCTATAGVSFPAQKKAYQLPHGIQAQTAGHYRVTREMTVKKPEVRVDIQLGDDFAFAELPASLADMGDAIEHQHIREWELCIAGAEELALATLDKFVVVVGALGLEAGHIVIRWFE
jgi:hypothetical protein